MYQSKQEHLRFTGAHNVLPHQPDKTGTLKIHRCTQCPPTSTGENQINFSFLSNCKEPCCSQKYTTKRRCRHVDHGFDSLAQFRTTHAYCMEKHMDADEIPRLDKLSHMYAMVS